MDIEAAAAEEPAKGEDSRFGPVVSAEGVGFRLWAPDLSGAVLRLLDGDGGETVFQMQPVGEGFFELFAPEVTPGTLYRFEGGGIVFPDPASRCQAEDADGWSVVVAPLPPPRFRRAIRPFTEAVFAEVHVGAATPEGTFAGLRDRLRHYLDAGYTAIELMPLAEFEGDFNWGYDGVLPFAPDRSYGTPEELRALVDAAHGLGLAVIVDLVYNHFGALGNYLSHYASDFVGKVDTPWGASFDYDNPIVAGFFHENIRMWLSDYDMDGARFDAVHHFGDGQTRETFVRSLVAAARAVKPDAWLVAENSMNMAHHLARDERGRPLLFDAQWNEDFQHVLQALASGETKGFVANYVEDPVGKLERALKEGFAYQGEYQPWDKIHRGEPSGHLPPSAFVNFAQNHDQIGNRPRSDRMAAYLPDERLEFTRAMTMLSPQTPLFFMGEEAHDDTPFHFFSDAPEHLHEALREGRSEQVMDGYSMTERPDLPDAWDPATLERSRIGRGRWDEGAIERFRGLSERRRRLLWPLAKTAYLGAASRRYGDALLVAWSYERGDYLMVVNPTDVPALVAAVIPADAVACGAVRGDGAGTLLDPWTLAVWTSREAR